MSPTSSSLPVPHLVSGAESERASDPDDLQRLGLGVSLGAAGPHLGRTPAQAWKEQGPGAQEPGASTQEVEGLRREGEVWRPPSGCLL